MLLWVKALDPLGSGCNAHGHRFLPEGAILEPMVYLSIDNGVGFGDESSGKKRLRLRWLCTRLGGVQRLLVRQLVL
jgi:hypothetical protein